MFFHRTEGVCSLWTPPPECARQVIVNYLSFWVQRPMNTGAIFLIPRVPQGFWGRTCRHVEEMGVFQPRSLPEGCIFDSPLPFVLLCTRPHQHCRRHVRNRMGRIAFGPNQPWHEEQAEVVRGLQWTLVMEAPR